MVANSSGNGGGSVFSRHDLRENPIFVLFNSLGVIDEKRLEEYAPGTRDISDLPVLRDRESGVIFLSRLGNRDLDYYEAKTESRDAVFAAGKASSLPVLEDDIRRAAAFGSHVQGKAWLDIGTGAAGLMELLGHTARCAVGIEPQLTDRQAAVVRGLDVRRSLNDVADEKFDVTTLFHVLEHLPHPLQTLTDVRAMLNPNGIVIIEVPHARDFLLHTLDCATFRAFTLWSEHLILHTRESLKKLMIVAGLGCRSIDGYQRYPLSNHLYWLRNGRPGGHEAWAFVDTPELNSAYAAALARQDQTDTLIAIATAPDLP